MRSKASFSIYTLFLAIATLVAVNSCRKAEDKQFQPNPPIYTNGHGEIGSLGGTVMIDNPDSPIHGARLVIPAGAIDKEITIKIQEADKNYEIPGYENPIVIQCYPDGQEFSKAVELYLPYTGDASMAYAFDAEMGSIEQLEVLEIDQSNKLIKTRTNQLSLYFAEAENITMDLKLVKSNGKFAAYAVLLNELEDIPTHWSAPLYDNAYDVARGVSNEYVVRFSFNLNRKLSSGLSEPVANKAYYVSWHGYSSLITIEESYNIFDQDAAGHSELFSTVVYSADARINTWMRGAPLLMIFDEDSFLEAEFSYDEDDAFFVSCTWSMNEPWNPDLSGVRWTNLYQFGDRGPAKSWNDLDLFSDDGNNNGIIDEYEDPTTTGPCKGQTTLSYGGQTYKIVEIGGQCWMAENLNYKYGSSVCYDNDSSNCDKYGMLYNRSDGQAACPEGWSLPVSVDWCSLLTYMDPTSFDCSDNTAPIGWFGVDVGYKMKGTSGWYSNGNGSDAFGFATLPGGYQRPDGSFNDIEKFAFFWTKSGGPWANGSFYYGLNYGYHGVYSGQQYEKNGYSVRCLKN